jgi:hypothetical protein
LSAAPSLTGKTSIGIFFVICAALVVATFQDYGITRDEPIQVDYGRHLLNWYASGFQDDGVLSSRGRTWLYGGLFETVATAAASIAPLSHYDTRHLLNAAIGILGIAAAYRLGALAGGTPTGLICAVMLLLTPRYYGHMFNNPKDLPFAVGYLWSLYFIIRHAREMPRPSLKLALLTGLSIGLTLAIRVNGVILVVYWLVADAVALSPYYKSRDGLDIPQILSRILPALGLAYATMIAFWPWAQVNPVTGPLDAIRLFASFDENHHSLFRGEYIDSLNLPLDYIPTWLFIGFPEILWLGSICLMVVLFQQRRRMPDLDLLAALSAAFLFPCLYAMLNRTPLYDGLRHLLFAMPPLVVLSGIGIVSLGRMLDTPRLRTMFQVLVATSLFLPASEMIRLHPFQTSYFSHLAGTLNRNWNRYDADYWMISYKQGLKWVLAEYPKPENRRLRVAGLFPGGVFDQIPSAQHIAVNPWEDPDVVLGSVRFGDHRVIPGETCHIVRAGAAELLYVIRPDSAYASHPMFAANEFIDTHRMRVFSRGAERAEAQGDLPNAIYRYATYAEAASRQGKEEDALKAEAKITYLFAANPQLDPKSSVSDDRPDVVNAAAEEAIRRGQFELAGRLLGKLLGERSSQKYEKNWLVALWGSGQFARGLEESGKYLQHYPNDVDGLVLKGMMMIGIDHPHASRYVDSLKIAFPDNGRIQSLQP